jgi:hypothetical protein
MPSSAGLWHSYSPPRGCCQRWEGDARFPFPPSVSPHLNISSSHKVLSRVRSALELPLGGKSLTLFKRIISEREREELLGVCISELAHLDTRIEAGDTATAVLALLEKMQSSRSSKL